ncbi:S-layer homology domain-containing protein [Cohnella sp. 56]|uniref:S-layer homology domain-containing protein n=1 Tax=Cohnella sp. 56 TaxID=3113722 RepID=UPI0030E7ABC2
MKKSIAKIVKKSIAGIIATTLITSLFPLASFAADSTADNIRTAPSYAILGSNVETKLMSVQAVPYDAGKAKVVTKDGTDGWEINPDGWPGFIRVNVDDSYIFGGKNRVEVDVKYFDEASDDGVLGKFTIAYNSVDAAWKEAETVQLTGTNKWLVHKFILEDAKFANESEGSDFRVAFWAQNMGESPKPVAIGAVSVQKLRPIPTASSYALLGSNLETKLMSVQSVAYEQGVLGKVVTKDGMGGWEINPQSWPGFIRVNVDDSYIYGGNNRVEVDVEYFDESSDDGKLGKFTIAYNSIEATWKEAETVQLTGTNKWMVHKFVLEDAKFANESEGSDFRVAFWAQKMGESPKPVTIGSISVEKLKRVSMTGTSDKVGNIFDVNEEPAINLEFVNEHSQPDMLSVDYQVFDAAYGRLLKTGSVSVEAAPNGAKTIEKLKLDIKEKGVYTLIVNAKDADGTTDIQQDIPFSVIQKLDPANTLANSVFGAQTHLAWGGMYNAEKIAPLFKDIGAKYARDEYYWSNVETTKGVYTFPAGYDQYIDTLIQNGIVPLVELNFGNSFYDGGKAPRTPEAVAAYANYCKAVVEHLKGKVKYFEIWNEWNGSFGDGLGVKEYNALLQAAYTAIKTVNPDTVVMGGAVAASDYGWLESLLKAGGGDYMDAISFHPYTTSGPEGAKFAETMVRVKESFKKLGFDKPMWATEIGWSSGNHSEVEQAAFATQIKTLVLANPGVLDKVLWYDSLNDGMDKEDYESNFGLLSQRGPYSAKPAYVALSANENLLGDASFVKEYKLDDNVRILKFHSASKGKDILAVWTKNKSQTIGLNLGTDKLTTVDLFGNGTDTTAAHNILSTTVTGTPVYYVGNFSDQLSLAAPNFKAQSEALNVAAGDTVTVNISRSAAAAAMSGEYRVSLPEGWRLEGDASFRAGQSIDTLTFTVPDGYAHDSDTIAIVAFDRSGNKVGEMKIDVKMVNPIVVSVAANPVNPADARQDWELLVEIENNYSKLSLPAGKLSVTEPADWANNTEAVKYDAIDPGQSRVIKLPIPAGAIKEGTHVKLTIQPDTGDAIYIDQIINDLSMAMYAQGQMTVDGDITDGEWGNAQATVIDQASQVVGISDWGGAEDLSAEFRTMWDDDYLYLAIKATDNVHHQPYTDGSTWQADGIQLAIDPGRVYGAGSRGYNEIGFALNDDGTVQKYRWIAVPGQFSGAFDHMKVAIKRNEADKTTSYEAAIPWAEIMPEGMTPKSGTDIGFSFLINDSDGGARRGWIQYMEGIGGDKNPKYLADLVLKGVPPVTGLTLTSDAQEASVEAGQSFRLTAALSPADAAIKSVVFTSGNDKVASVSDVKYDAATGTTSARITGLQAGDGIVTATARDGGATAEYRFVVKEATDPGTGDDEAPGQVSAVGVTSADGKLILTWNDPADTDLAYIRIAGKSEGGQPIAGRQVDAGVRRAELDGLTNGVSYSVTLTAVDAAGHESEAVTVQGTPSAPYIPNPPVTPVTDPSKPVIDSRGIAVEASADASGLASVALGAADLEGAIKALAGAELRIAVKPNAAAAGVRVALPSDALLAASAAGKLSSIVIDNGLAPVTIDAQWLATQAKAGDTVTLTVAKADVSKLPQATQDQLAGRPVYDFKLEVGGRSVEQFGKRGAVHVAVPYSLGAGQQAGQAIVYSIDDEGRMMPVVNSRYDAATGTVRFAPAHFSLYAAASAKTLFTDLQQHAWAAPAVEALAARGAVRGDGNGMFRPNGIVTRAEFVTMLANAFELASGASADAPAFTDVAAGQWYTDAVASAAKLGIVTGRPDGTFGLNAPITRQEMAAMLYRAANQLQLDLTASSAAQAAMFTDADAIAPYAQEAAAAMQRAGILQGTGAGAFTPAASATRAQAATAIYRLFEQQ